MSKFVFRYKRDWHLEASPEALWPFISNTHRVNYQTGSSPAVVHVEDKNKRLPNAYKKLQASFTQFEEKPFDWVQPNRFTSSRKFLKLRLFDELGSDVNLVPKPDGGTHLQYEMWASAGYWYTSFLVPLLIRKILNAFNKPILLSDKLAQQEVSAQHSLPAKNIKFSPGGRKRLSSLMVELSDALETKSELNNLCPKLSQLLESADEIELAKIRPYSLADHWGVKRRPVLELFLWATRMGLLTMSWEILCPSCQGSKQSNSSLTTLSREVHCATCNIDITTNLARSVELVFKPSPAIRTTKEANYCLGGPFLTPHIIVQQLLSPGEQRELFLPLEKGHYRVRALELPYSQVLIAEPQFDVKATISISEEQNLPKEVRVSTHGATVLENLTNKEQLLIIERTAWNDQAVAATEVIAMQAFRDLFVEEVLRPDENFEVGSVTILFTDICDSTQMYQDVGDAVAFGKVAGHFDVLQKVISEENGSIVKNIGDAIMGVFLQPVDALKAATRAHALLENPIDGSMPIHIKAGIHHGPCIAVTLNGKLDYFGSTVNMASRLEGKGGKNLCVLSDIVRNDPEVIAYLEELELPAKVTPFSTQVKGFGEKEITLWKLDFKSVLSQH